MADWPEWEALTSDQRAMIENGLGPGWLPLGARCLLTRIGALFFREADWGHHDYGYTKGGSEWVRLRCDWLFFRAMIRDALRCGLFAAPFALTLALIFWLAVMALGWAAFAYGPQDPPWSKVPAINPETRATR